MTPNDTARPWYSKGAGRLVRALLGLPALGLASWLVVRGGTLSLVGAAFFGLLGLSLPLAAVFKEPD